MFSRAVIVLFGVILALGSLPCLAGMPENVTAAEMSMLPPYCPSRFNLTDPNMFGAESQEWARVFGGKQNLAPVHHYCWALVNIRRADNPPPRGAPGNWRALTIQYAIGDIDYAIVNALPDFKLLPEMFTVRANALVKLKQNKEAVLYFIKAAQAKPDYWPAFAGLAQMYLGMRQNNEARGVVEEGLKYAPASQTLKALLADLQKSGAKSVPLNLDLAQTVAPSKTPAPQDSVQQPEPSPAK